MMEDPTPQQEDTAVVDVPDSSVDDIPTNEYSDDNIDDIVEENRERPSHEHVEQYADGVEDMEEPAAGGAAEEVGAATGPQEMEGAEEEPPVTSTPRTDKEKGKSPGKTLKQRLGQSKPLVCYCCHY